jgi:hypothetical protein
MMEHTREWLSPGMLSSPLGDLSHTSILYYCSIIDTKIFECWSQGVSKNKKSLPTILRRNAVIEEPIWDPENSRPFFLPL